MDTVSTQRALEIAQQGMQGMMEVANSAGSNDLRMVAVGFAGVILGAVLVMIVWSLKRKAA